MRFVLAALVVVLSACTTEPLPLPSCAEAADQLEESDGDVISQRTVCGGFSDGESDTITFGNFLFAEGAQIQLHALNFEEPGALCLEDMISIDAPAGVTFEFGNCFQLSLRDVPFRGEVRLTFTGPASAEYFFEAFFFRAQ